MDLKNSARKKNEIYKRSVVYKGEFKNGNLDGIVVFYQKMIEKVD
jgi:hypothetical protein